MRERILFSKFFYLVPFSRRELNVEEVYDAILTVSVHERSRETDKYKKRKGKIYYSAAKMKQRVRKGGRGNDKLYS